MPPEADVHGSHADESPGHTSLQRRVEGVLDWGQRIGIGFRLPERVLAWWKLIGFRKAALGTSPDVLVLVVSSSTQSRCPSPSLKPTQKSGAPSRPTA